MKRTFPETNCDILESGYKVTGGNGVISVAKILVVEDDRAIAEAICNWMTFEHHVVESAHDGDDAIALLQGFAFDLLVLDWELPGASGIEILKHFRKSDGDAPVLMLTGKSAISDKQTGFDAGADDYLTKPFDAQELLMRVRALLRRGKVAPSSKLQIADLCLDVSTCSVTRSGRELKLTAKEIALLEFLMKHPNQVFSNDSLLDRIWHSEADVSSETVRVLMNRMRAKVDYPGVPELIHNVRGMGYKIESL